MFLFSLILGTVSPGLCIPFSLTEEVSASGGEKVENLDNVEECQDYCLSLSFDECTAFDFDFDEDCCWIFDFEVDEDDISDNKNVDHYERNQDCGTYILAPL